MKNIIKNAYDLIRDENIKGLENLINSKDSYYDFRTEIKDILYFCIEFQYYDATKLIVNLVDEDYILPLIPLIDSKLKEPEIFQLFVDTYFDNLKHEEFILQTFYMNSEKNLQYLMEVVNKKKFDEITLDIVIIENVIFNHKYGFYTFELFMKSDIIDLWNNNNSFIKFIIKTYKQNKYENYDLYIKLVFNWFDRHNLTLNIVKEFKINSIDYKKYMG